VAPRSSNCYAAGVIDVYLNPIYRTRMSRIAWSLLRHPVKCREYPAKAERLVTPDELVRFGI
jgi:hypothetical protein